MLNYSVVKKYIVLSTITMLFIFLGSNVQNVLAGNDIGTMMKNWFAKEQSQSADEVYEAISAEKDLLLAELQQTIEDEQQRAMLEIEQFKQREIANRISSLRSYAAILAEGITIDTSAEKDSIMAELDSIFANAVSQMGGTSSKTHPPLPNEKPEKEDNVAEGETEKEATADKETSVEEENPIDDKATQEDSQTVVVEEGPVKGPEVEEETEVVKEIEVERESEIDSPDNEHPSSTNE